MGRNLPPGVAVSDLPGYQEQPEPECRHCSSYPSQEAMADGYPLCDDHDTAEARERYDEYKERRCREAEARRKRKQHQREESPPEDIVEDAEQTLAERYRDEQDDREYGDETP